MIPTDPVPMLHAARQIVVRDTQALAEALVQLDAQGGGTILLDGTAGPFQIDARGLHGPAPILITALDPQQKPVIESIHIVDCAHITLSQTRIDRAGIFTPDQIDIADIRIQGSRHISLLENTMSGLATGYLSEHGPAAQANRLATIRDSEDIVIADNRISHYYHALSFAEVAGLRVSGNELSHMQGDGVQMVGVQDVVITANHMHDFFGSTQTLNHSDMIQLWSTGAQSRTRNVLISDNLLDAGHGAGHQGILIAHEALGMPGPGGQPHEAITITGNLIHTGSPLGIRVGGSHGVEIAHNTLLWDRGAAVQKDPFSAPVSRDPVIHVNQSHEVTVAGNIARKITVDDSPVGQGNLLLDYQDRSSADYVHRHIVNLSGLDGLDLRDLRLRAESPANGVFGAPLGWAPSAEGFQVVLRAHEDAQNRQVVMLSALESLLDGVPIDPARASFVWRFGEGIQVQGARVAAHFALPGIHEITLEVAHDSGAHEIISRSINVRANDILVLPFTDGARDVSWWGVGLSVVGDDGHFVLGRTGGGFLLDGTSLLTLERAHAPQFDLASFSLQLEFQALHDTEQGVILRLHETMDLAITAQGALRFRLQTDQGSYLVQSPDGVMGAGGWHAIALSYDGARLRMIVDGQVLASTVAEGVTASAGYHAFQIGDAWGQGARGIVDNLMFSTRPLEGWADTVVPVDGSLPVVAVALDGGLAAGPGRGQLLVALEAADVIDLTLARHEIPRTHEFLHARQDLRIDLRLETDLPGAQGVFMALHGAFSARVDEFGHVRFRLSTDAGTFEIRSGAAIFSDAGAHALAFLYDEAAGVLQLVVDGRIDGQVAALGTTAPAGYWGLVLGNPWGPALPGRISEFAFYDAPLVTALSDGGGPTPDTELRFEGTFFDHARPETEFLMPAAPMLYEAGPSGLAYRLTGENSVAFARGEVAALHESTGFSLSFDFRQDPGAAGRIMHLHQVFEVALDAQGRAFFTLFTDQGRFHIESAAAIFDDGDWHNLQIVYDDSEAELQMLVDDIVVSSIVAQGESAPAAFWGLTVGAAWGDSAQGLIDNLLIVADPDHADLI